LPKAYARLKAGQPLKIVCLGDSVTGLYYHTGGRRAYTDMIPFAVRGVFSGARLDTVNAGISGNSTRDALARLERDVLAHRPHVVTVMFGLNDMVRVPLNEFRDNLAKIIKRCRAIEAEILLCTPNGVIETAGRPTAKLIEYCDTIRAVGRAEKEAGIFCRRGGLRSQDLPRSGHLRETAPVCDRRPLPVRERQGRDSRRQAYRNPGRQAVTASGGGSKRKVGRGGQHPYFGLGGLSGSILGNFFWNASQIWSSYLEKAR
jgi:hypothetical protein